MTEPRRAISFRAGLTGITLGALVLRVVYVLTERRDFALKGDDYFYHWQGRAIADGLGFINPLTWQALDRFDPTAAHPPLYSLFLAAVSKVGVTSPTGHRLASCILGALAVAVIGLVAHRIAGNRAGLLAAGIAAVYPHLWINDGGLVSETPYALLIAGVLLAAYAWIDDPKLWRMAILGALVALAALTRPEAILLLPPMGVVLLLGRDRKAPHANGSEPAPDVTPLPRRFATVAVLGAAGLLVISPWLVRNFTTFENPVLLASGHGSVLQVANCPTTYEGPFLGYWDVECVTGKRPPENERQRRLRENSEVPGLVYLIDQDDRDESVADVKARKAAFEFIGDNLDRAPLVAAARVGRVWNVFRPFQGVDFDAFFERRGLWESRVGLAMFYVLAALSIFQLVTMWKRRIAIWPMIAVILMTTITAAISIGITRYRVGSDVVLVVLGGLAIDQLWSRVRAHASS